MSRGNVLQQETTSAVSGRFVILYSDDAVPSGTTTGPVIVSVGGTATNSALFSIGSGTISGTVLGLSKNTILDIVKRDRVA
jgi:hypothetical protein